ncbi:2TM domain-containing protein [Patiriisocius hiemis]|uniref:2TM domain-containing protein n=1 Tax=Patiriisocius hiemis TaxID=3075604 RepID=A0ABU2Y9V3_9FLAO|nr:2TM domain-containing protein [Constantimarinum sp. W242]MDT0554429.1 2TM domain-containing protein [Constantimarinum sp. W242]
MELDKMEDYNVAKIEKAKKRIKDIKGFYSHLAVYLVINLIIILVMFDVKDMVRGYQTMDDFNTWFTLNTFSTAILWGIGLFIHWLYVFGPSFKLFKKWEERKIKEFIEKEEETNRTKFN